MQIPANNKDVTMNQPHRPQRSERKDPFPQIPFVIEDDHVPGDTWASYAIGFGAVVLVLVILWNL